jgi:hypothetical protein
MMIGMFGRRRAPLTGAPANPRQKTYSAQSGYVYQYFYLGQRAGKRDRQPGTEYVFDVSADRKSSFPVSVFVGDPALQAWETRCSRLLQANERYAIAKMALFQAFDERSTPAEMHLELRVREADVQLILGLLGIA